MPDASPPDDLWTSGSAAAEAVENAAATARRRLSRRSAGWWRGEARSGRRRADVVADLVATLAAADPTSQGRTPRRPARDAVLADQLAVVAYDLVLALRDGAEAVPDVVAAIEAALADVDPRSSEGPA